ncbi:hypothetical protein ColTof4_11986 [Colletotrichum tofieldiae]|uniref:Uncharacterized protein n=1 Tax=Colletotrichum tofieldiae TaxID=708197 RepID=A0A166VJ20_9PEZI|nr:hypothetical protein CT0861_00043 [Colletotrichum tofieldiae]GKT58059.1 hypothetical protein ColTof3_05398 [Colletotrichum tofieldiae]GKT79563.1 hypothetical protein ColTof4_11986 [Colletotrichum tofieldiae]
MFPIHSSRSGGHKHPKRSEKRDKDHRPKDTPGKQDRALPGSYFSFLFVVNELQILEENGLAPVADIYGNPLPPTTARGYGLETTGQVWRYRDGVVSLADGFYWYRPEPGSPGAIYATLNEYFDERGQPLWTPVPMPPHSTFSVFNCWRFLPCLYTDVDVTTVDDMGVDNKFSPLAFTRDSLDSGVTRIRASGGPQRHVAGSKPSWMPTVLPETYAAPTSSAQQSTGLGGCLPIIIGLLALTKRPGHTDDVFRDGEWNGNRFRGSRSSRAEPEPTGPVRGVLVHVCCDMFNPDSTIDAIVDFEERGKAIRDERS